MHATLRFLPLFATVLLLVACPSADAKKRKTGKTDKPPIPVAVETATRGAIASFYETTSTLTAEKSAPVLARVKGMITSINREEGDLVKEGEVLLTIEQKEYSLLLAQATARTEQLKRKDDRLSRMVKKQLVPLEEYETVKHELDAAVAQEEIARLNLARTRVRTPFNGMVVRRSVDVGQTVSDGSELFTLSDLDPLLALVHVPSKEFRRIAQDQPVKLTLDSSKVELTGRIKLISPIIDPASGTIKITVEIPEYPSGTRPGDFAEVRLVTERRQDVVLVPRVAVVEDRQDQVVFVAQEGKAVRRQVKVGFEQDKNAEIIEGIGTGDPVVVKGQHALKDGSPLKILGSGS